MGSLLAVVFWKSALNHQTELTIVVALAAIVVFVQAIQARKYFWAAGFLTIALVVNPALPIYRLAGSYSLPLIVLSIVPFAYSLIELRPRPVLSMPSITHISPGSRSL